MSENKFDPRPYTLFANEKTRADEKYEFDQFVDSLPMDKVYTIKIREGEERRKDVANRLYQLVIGQVSKQMLSRSDEELDSDPSVIAGKLKRHILMPMKPVMAAEYDDDKLRDEAEFERQLCDLIAMDETITEQELYMRYDRAIRSKTMNTKPFARYLDRVIDRLTMQGFVIKLRPSDKLRALGELMRAAA